jgi:protein SCO1
VLGLTGPEEEVREIGKEYGLFFEKNAETAEIENYLVDHTTQSYLIDRDGNLRVIYNYSAGPEAIVANIRQYL